MARRKIAAPKPLALEQVVPLIHEIRGEKVILDIGSGAALRRDHQTS